MKIGEISCYHTSLVCLSFSCSLRHDRFRAALDFVTRFLNKVAGQEDSNRMSAHGLAIVLSPNLLRNPDGDPLIFKVQVTS